MMCKCWNHTKFSYCKAGYKPQQNRYSTGNIFKTELKVHMHKAIHFLFMFITFEDEIQ